MCFSKLFRGVAPNEFETARFAKTAICVLEVFIRVTRSQGRHTHPMSFLGFGPSLYGPCVLFGPFIAARTCLLGPCPTVMCFVLLSFYSDPRTLTRLATTRTLTTRTPARQHSMAQRAISKMPLHQIWRRFGEGPTGPKVILS